MYAILFIPLSRFRNKVFLVLENREKDNDFAVDGTNRRLGMIQEGEGEVTSGLAAPADPNGLKLPTCRRG